MRLANGLLKRKYNALIASVVGSLLFAAAHASAPHLTDWDNTVLRPPRKERTINFPAKFSLGELVLSSTVHVDHEKGLRAHAKGKVVIPANRYVCLVLSPAFFRDPNLVKSLPHDSVDSLYLSAVHFEENGESICDQTMEAASHLDTIVELSVGRSDVTDKGMTHAARFTDLEKLVADMADLNGSCFKELSGLKKLGFVALANNHIRDENVKFIAALPSLQHLELARNGLSDTGAKGLAGCNKLMWLSLGDNAKVTDACLPTLKSLPKLRHLKLGGTSVSTKGVLKLQGMPLVELELPDDHYSPTTLKQIKEAFPRAKVNVRVHKVDEETKQILAPLH